MVRAQTGRGAGGAPVGGSLATVSGTATVCARELGAVRTKRGRRGVDSRRRGPEMGVFVAPPVPAGVVVVRIRHLPVCVVRGLARCQGFVA